MPVSRVSIIRGPAVIEFGGNVFYSKGDIELEVALETVDIQTSIHGKVDERARERSVRVRFTPAGEWENLSVLWPYASMAIGASIFGGTDVPLSIRTKAGTRIQFAAAAVTGMPDIILSAQETMIGQVEFTILGADNTAWTTDESLFAISSEALSDTSFASSSIKVQPYTAAWGASSPWSSIQSMDGFRVSFSLSTTPVSTDADGVVDHLLSDLAVTCRAKPVGITEAQLLAALTLQGASAARGRSLNAGSNNLVITGTGVSVTLTGAAMKSGGLVFGAVSPRVADVEWVATRTYSAGVAQPLFALA